MTILLPMTPLASATSSSMEDLMGAGLQARRNHARELLGKAYPYSVVKQVEGNCGFHAFIRKTAKSSLKGYWKSHADIIASAIIREAYRNSLDPMFILSVIETESSFKPEARGRDGEIGLMQLMPATAEAVARRHGLAFEGAKTLLDPVANIRLGAAYFGELRDHFHERGPLYVAAYNMGAHKVSENLKQHVISDTYSSRIMHKYLRHYTEMAKVKGAVFASAGRDIAAY